MHIQTISIIYNPNSTGKSRELAEELSVALQEKVPKTKVELLATRFAGHAEELAYEIAKTHKKPLIVSSSGDGGYHEVINGALRAQAEGSTPICAVLPAGNANDHARTLQHAPLLQLISEGNVRKIDVLQASIQEPGSTKTRFAHSYIGFGFTPHVARELNSRDLNPVMETWAVAKSFLKRHPVYAEISGKEIILDNLICSTIPEMAKLLTIDKQSKPDDGLFEIALSEHHRRAGMLLHFAKGTVSQFGAVEQTDIFSLKLIRRAAAQLDGEILNINKGAAVTITIQKQVLPTLV
jgi:diacylglycerol kinase family enzyme